MLLRWGNILSDMKFDVRSSSSSNYSSRRPLAPALHLNQIGCFMMRVVDSEVSIATRKRFKPRERMMMIATGSWNGKSFLLVPFFAAAFCWQFTLLKMENYYSCVGEQLADSRWQFRDIPRKIFFSGSRRRANKQTNVFENLIVQTLFLLPSSSRHRFGLKQHPLDPHSSH